MDCSESLIRIQVLNMVSLSGSFHLPCGLTDSFSRPSARFTN